MHRDAEEFVDASLFLGMHSREEAVRIACKGFFVERLLGAVTMNLEQVGKCDDIVWRHRRALQDAYYPFMDNLHTVMRIRRCSYDDADVGLAASAPTLQDLPVTARLLVAMVLNRRGVLYTVDETLLRRTGLPIRTPAAEVELEFPEHLERLYHPSLTLRFSREEV